MILKCKKKPIEVEAIQFDGTASNANEIHKWSNEKTYLHASENYLVVRTLEGDVRASPGSYIVKGVENEVWPITENIFNKTYEILK